MKKSRALKRSRHEARVQRHRAKAAARHKAWQKEKHIRQNRPGGYVPSHIMPLTSLFDAMMGRAA